MLFFSLSFDQSHPLPFPEPTPQKRERKKGNSPQEEAECGRSRRDAEAADDGEGDGAGEPEDGGDGVEGAGGLLVVQVGEVERRQGDVGEHQQRPDRVEDHEADARRRVGLERVRDCFFGGEVRGGWRSLLSVYLVWSNLYSIDAHIG